MASIERKESPSSERKDAELLDEIEEQNGGHVDRKAHIAALEKTSPEILAMSPEEKRDFEKKLVRRIDLTVLPILMIMYILNYLDRNNIAAARLYGIAQDTGLVGSEYQTVISVLFASYIFFQVPSNIIASKLKYPGIYINVMMAGWGVVSAATAAARDFNGLVIVRVFLGIFEAAFFPGAVYLLSCWYTKKELGLRTAILFSGSQLGNAFGTLIARGILTLDGVHGIAGWRWLFIVEGVATVGLAVIFGILLPNLPQTSWNWQFNKLQRDFAVYRLEVEAGDTEEEVGGWEGFRLAVTDIKTYFLMGILSLAYVAGAVNSFFPSVVSTLGFSPNNTLLLTAPPFLFCTLCMFFNGWHADRTNERCLHVSVPLLVTIISMVMAISSTSVGVRYTAMMLMPGSFYSAAIVTLTWISQSMPRPAQKRAVALAFINSFGNTPNIWCSYLYQSSMAPRYLEAFATNIVACAMAIALAFGLRFYLKRENARMDRGEPVKDITPEMVAVGFRYKY